MTNHEDEDPSPWPAPVPDDADAVDADPVDADAVDADAVEAAAAELGDGGDDPVGGGGTQRPSWLVPAAGVLIVALVVALVLILMGGDDAVAPTTDAPVVTTSSTSAPETVAPIPAATDAPGDESETGLAPDTVAAPETTAAPDTTAAPAPETTATPETTTAPETTTTEPAPPETDPPPEGEVPESTEPREVVDGITAATPGFVRIGDTEYPILRTCQTEPLAPDSTDSAVFSYVFNDDLGATNIVERWFDASGVTGYYNGTYETVAIGERGFGMSFLEGDGVTPLSVNPESSDVDECPGIVSRTTPGQDDAPYNYGIVDICFGDQTGTLKYEAYLSQGGSFTGAVNPDGTLRFEYWEGTRPYANPTVEVADFGVGIALRTPVAGIGVAQGAFRDLSVGFSTEDLRDCTPFD